MSISSDIARLQEAKTDLTSWLTENGVTVPSGAKLDTLVGLLDNVDVGAIPQNYGLITYNGFELTVS